MTLKVRLGKEGIFESVAKTSSWQNVLAPSSRWRHRARTGEQRAPGNSTQIITSVKKSLQVTNNLFNLDKDIKNCSKLFFSIKLLSINLLSIKLLSIKLLSIMLLTIRPLIWYILVTFLQGAPKNSYTAKLAFTKNSVLNAAYESREKIGTRRETRYHWFLQQ